MIDIVNALSSQTGIGIEQIRKGLGAVLKALQGHLPPDQFSKVEGAIPDSGEMMSASESATSEGGGLVHSVTSLAGKLLGGRGEAATDLISRLGQLGFSADQLQAFLPRVLEFLRAKLPPDVLEKVEGLMPGSPQVAAPSNP